MQGRAPTRENARISNLRHAANVSLWNVQASAMKENKNAISDQPGVFCATCPTCAGNKLSLCDMAVQSRLSLRPARAVSESRLAAAGTYYMWVSTVCLEGMAHALRMSGSRQSPGSNWLVDSWSACGQSGRPMQSFLHSHQAGIHQGNHRLHPVALCISYL